MSCTQSCSFFSLGSAASGSLGAGSLSDLAVCFALFTSLGGCTPRIEEVDFVVSCSGIGVCCSRFPCVCDSTQQPITCIVEVSVLSMDIGFVACISSGRSGEDCSILGEA